MWLDAYCDPSQTSLSLSCRLWTLLLDVMRRLPWSSASSWPTRPESDGGTGPGACSHTACRTSWCRKDCSPDRRGSKSPVNYPFVKPHFKANTLVNFKWFYLISNKTLHSMFCCCFGNAGAQVSAPTNTLWSNLSSVPVGARRPPCARHSINWPSLFDHIYNLHRKQAAVQQFNSGTSYRSNTDSHSAQVTGGAQNQKLFFVRGEGVFGHKTLFKQPNGRHRQSNTRRNRT